MKPKKKLTIDGKPFMFFNEKKTAPKKDTLKNTYKQIPDNKKIPVMFMTRKQYLQQYIKNQEQKQNIDFPKRQEQKYIKKEMPTYNNILARYTTKQNKYFQPAVVFFNDKKIPAQQFKRLAFHEYGHEHVEKNKLKMPLWKEEQYAMQFEKNGKPPQQIRQDNKSKNGGELFWNELNNKNMFFNIQNPKQLKQIRKLYEKQPELLAVSKNLLFTISKTLNEPKGSYILPTSENRKRIDEWFGPDSGAEYDELRLRKNIFINPNVNPGQTLKHELTHREQYRKDPVVHPKITVQHNKELEKLNNQSKKEFFSYARQQGYTRQGIQTMWREKTLPKELKDKANEFLKQKKDYYYNIPYEKEAFTRMKEPRERDIKVPQEQIDEVFVETFGDEEPKVVEPTQDVESKNRLLTKVFVQQKHGGEEINSDEESKNGSKLFWMKLDKKRVRGE